MKIVQLEGNSLGNQPDFSAINALGNYVNYDDTPKDKVISRIKDADIVIVNKIEITREIMEQCSHLKLICVSATGTNNVDHQAAKEHTITVKNVKGYSSESVAQITWGMILQLANKINYFDQYVKEGRYSSSPLFTNFGRVYHELHTMQLGIIGLGNIGERVAKIAEAFHMKIAFHSPSGKREHPTYKKMTLDALLVSSDVISIHTPLNEKTLNLIGINELKRMKERALIINTARGGIVNENDLVQAIDEDIIAGAGVDVFTKEPIELSNPLSKINKKEKIILTPHIAWTSVQARETLIKGVAENIKSFVESFK